ncbi:MAG TPA: AI-2E family transporter [Thermodesulfobacteriota bacterium]|nr:AI-2E family transporter [Thermodesulfobacteriota bacterium]
MIPRNESTPTGMLFKVVVAAAGVLLSAYLLWKLRSLIGPVAVGGLMAYICRPLVAHLERYRVPRGLAIGLLLLAFVLATLFIVNRVRAIMPTEIGAIEFKVRAHYKLNEGYKTLMGLDQSLTRGNRIYQLGHEELDPIVDRINRLLALSPEERDQFLASRARGPDAPAGSDRLLDYYRANLHTPKVRAPAALPKTGAVRAAPPAAEAPEPVLHRPIATLGHVLSTWIIAPLIFLFLLRDTGEIKRGLLRAVPNRLFEPALIVLSDLDRALGNYLRGIFLECVFLGLTVALLLATVGIPLRWTIAIGIFAGATNVVPYLGSAVALVGGLACAFLAEEIHPIFPMVNSDNVAIWVIAAVALAELIKNVFYEPLVLGGAVKLHPLVVVIGVVGGGMLFDLVGVLLAVPIITVFRAFVSSTARQLKAYGLI